MKNLIIWIGSRPRRTLSLLLEIGLGLACLLTSILLLTILIYSGIAALLWVPVVVVLLGFYLIIYWVSLSLIQSVGDCPGGDSSTKSVQSSPTLTLTLLQVKDHSYLKEYEKSEENWDAFKW